MRRLLAALGLLLLLPLAAVAEGRSIIVLDASGSMWGQIGGRPKLDIAREALGEVLGDLPAGSEVGLMAYGHREKGSCEDIELLVPPGPGTGPAIAAAANALQFKGKTPLTEAVRRAAAELRSTEEKATVILITDGIETCEADPCALGAELEASGVDFTAHVVGFGLTEDEGQKVACLAEATGGLYLAAADLATLSEALVETVLVEPPPAPEPAAEPEPAPALEENLDPTLLLAPGGAEPADPDDGYFEIFPLAADGTRGDRLDTIYGQRKGLVPPGRYVIEAVLDSARGSAEVEVTADSLARPEVVVNAAHLAVNLYAQAGVETGDSGFWEVTGADGTSFANGFGSKDAYVPAGTYTLRATFGAAELSEPLTLTAGQELVRDVVLGTGRAIVSGYYVEGMAVEEDDQFIEILAARADLQGDRASFGYAYGGSGSFDLPPGDYVARVKLDGVQVDYPFAVTAGAVVDIAAVLNAGVAATQAPGASFQQVLSAKADIAGNRKEFGYSYEPAWQVTLPAGDYILQVTRGEAKTDTPFAIRAGERTEVTAPP